MTPTISIAVLMYWVAVSLTSPAMMDMPAVGAGAGATGGANAIGELLAGNAANNSTAMKRDDTDDADDAVDADATDAADEADDAASVNVAEPNWVRPETLPQGFIIVVEDAARQARKDVPIYLAGSINQWAAEDPNWQLEPRSDTRWQIQITPEKMGGLNPTGITFKFTMGGWDREELTADGGVPGNRTLPEIDASKLRAGELPIIELSVPQFRERDLNVTHRIGTYRDLDVTGRVVRLQVAGGSGSAVGVTRDLQIWLPPADIMADAPAGGFSVLYMFDGQNLFDPPEGSPAGEQGWQADETLTELIGTGEIAPIIVVGIPSSGARMEEYLPPTIGGDRAIGPGITASGDHHLDWVVNEVLPRVQAALPVATERERVAIGGASLGGAMALYAATRHPEHFGHVIAESPTTALRGDELGGTARQGDDRWRLERILTQTMTQNTAQSMTQTSGAPIKAIVTRGRTEAAPDQPASAPVNATGVNNTRRIAGLLSRAGTDVKMTIDPDGAHNEATWAKRFPVALRFLFAN